MFFFMRTGCIKNLCALALPSMLMALQGNAMAGEIYTCVDGHGRKITADRPIPECMDRQQLQLNKSGSVKGKVMPEPTAQEKAALEHKDRLVSEERQREADDKRRSRALLLRYPNPASHAKERNAALALVDGVISTSQQRQQELAAQRKAIDIQLEFYTTNPNKIPPALKRSLDENNAGVLEQQKFIASQASEKNRINQRFDEELIKLKQIWASAGASLTNSGASSATTNTAPASAY